MKREILKNILLENINKLCVGDTEYAIDIALKELYKMCDVKVSIKKNRKKSKKGL